MATDALIVEFRETVQRYAAGLLRYCLLRVPDRQLAEDAAQEAMLRLYAQLCDGKVIEDQGTWLFSIARNCCREMNRKRQTTTDVDSPDASQTSEPAFAELIEGLADRDRMLLILKHVDGLKCREIADRLNSPVGTITAALARVYSRLRGELAKELGHE